MSGLRARLSGVVGALALAVSPLAVGAGADADTNPVAPDLPATVSAVPLPTVQVDGIVWAQTIVGDTVYVTGRFATARPAGAEPGTGEVVRRNLLAYDIRTGELLPFRHDLNGEGRALAVSPDRKKLYVGGSFTRVDGKPRPKLAAFNLPSGALASGFTKGMDSSVLAVTATNTAVYVGGRFSKAAGKPRLRLAAFRPGGAVLPWRPKADYTVNAMVMSPDRKRVILGGQFGKINGQTFHALAAVAATRAGRPVSTWASRSNTFPIRVSGKSSGITSLSTDGTKVFLTAYSYLAKGRAGSFEGRAAINPVNGKLIWANDCHGDSYSAYPIGKVLYSANHAHDCAPAGAFPESEPRSWRRVLAETTDSYGNVNGPATGGYASYRGIPRSEQLVWYPQMNTGTVSGQKQAAWSVVGNAQYLSVGGEFTIAQGLQQQGLVRFRLHPEGEKSWVPERPPVDSFDVPPADLTGKVTVRFRETWDKDNEMLEYTLQRDEPGTNADPLVCEFPAPSTFWALDPLECDDDGVPVGTTPTYRLTVTDPTGATTVQKVAPTAG